ncbi:MFS transporter [Yinghuangia sp. YIM S10712]|uniref:MFS transporter n=1 Tax=Yinghuangia sp. YIM S10712 TaxID=3436930 RepID=UPI003F52FA8A
MRWWSLANAVSNIGTWMQLTVQNLLVFQITGSAAVTGLSLSVQAAAGLMFGVTGGKLVDRFPRKTIAALSQAALGCVAFGTAALIVLGLLNVPALLVLAAVTGLIATVDAPACALLGNDLVPEEDVPSAIALGSVVHSVGRLIGAASAGVMVGFLGIASVFAANGVSFVFVTAVILFLRPIRGRSRIAAVSPQQDGDRSAPTKRPSGTGREGVAYFMRQPHLVALAAVCAVSAVLGRNYALTLAVLVTGPLAGGAAEYGLVSTVLAVGGVLGAVLAGRLRRPSVRLVAVLAGAGGLLQATAGLAPTLLLLAVLIVPMSVVESVADTAATTVLQTDPPEHMRGRVLGVWSTLSTGWGLIGPPFLGLLMETAGARGCLVAGGLFIAAATAAGLQLTARRRVAEPAPAMA